jgi:hypothetical protein
LDGTFVVCHRNQYRRSLLMQGLPLAHAAWAVGSGNAGLAASLKRTNTASVGNRDW